MNTDMEALNELKTVLLQSEPVLFLGAGFSYGCSNEFGEMPKGDGLKKAIIDEFIAGKFSEEEEKELNGYNLQDICQFVYDSLNKHDELQEFIISKLNHARPNKYHLKLNSYPWKRIFSVNIDDLVEEIYKENGLSLVVQNKSKEQENTDACPVLYKLHGCVRNLEEGLVFSRSEYTSLMNKRNFKLDLLTTSILNDNIIFVGASLDEQDIDSWVAKYEDAGFQLRKGKIFFIDPKPSLKLKTRIKKMGGVLIEWTTEEFLNFIDSLKYNPTEYESRKKALNYAGFNLYNDIISIDSHKVYESRLYAGYACNWRDVLDNWVFETTFIEDIKNRCMSMELDEGTAYCISLYGKRFCGKGCAIKALGGFLSKCGYEVIEFSGKTFKCKVLQNYIESSQNTKFVLLVEDASYYYKPIEKLLKYNWKKNCLLIITTSRTYYHSKKRYYLDGNPYEDIELSDKINRENSIIIYNKLKEKGYTGSLPKKENEAIATICREDSFVNLFSDITYGKGFRQRLRRSSNNIISGNNNIYHLFLDLVIFDKCDLPYYPSELFVDQYDIDLSIFLDNNYDSLEKEQRDIVDFLRIDRNGLVLKNRLFVDMLSKQIDKKDIYQEIQILLKKLSSYVSERGDTYWRIVFESLLKEDVLSKVFRFKEKDIIEMYYGLKDYYADISYYWLQLGIAEQKRKDYPTALNHLNMARKIKPKAYQIQHAIARNYLKHANDESEYNTAKELFSIGEKKMLELINSKEEYKAKAKYFSIHCYVHEKIKYFMKYPNLINKEECLKMKSMIDRILDENNKYLDELIWEYMNMLKKHNLLSIIRMTHGDPYFTALGGKHDSSIDIDNEDMLIESL